MHASNLTGVMLSEAKHPRMRTPTDYLGKQTSLLCFGNCMVDAHPGTLRFAQGDRLRLVERWVKKGNDYYLSEVGITGS